MRKCILLIVALVSLFDLSTALCEEPAVASSLEITSMAKLASDLRLGAFKNTKFSVKVKIAVFDNGFWHYEDHLGKLLPAETVCYSDSKIPDEQCKDEYKAELEKATNSGRGTESKPYHGLLMAEIITQILARAGDHNYQIDLFRTSGLDRLNRAVKRAVDEKYDIIVYSDVWEFGGFGDGKGFVNAAVNEALRAGIIWINSAGNFGRAMRTADVESDRSGWVSFKNSKGKVSDGVSIRCMLTTPCNLRLVLSWNDFKDDPEVGTDKQLNLYLFDEKNNQVAASEKIQMLNPPMNDPKYSKLPRQMILTELAPDTAKKPKKYTVKVKNISNNFNPSSDKLRIMASGLGVEVLDPSVGETILPPADNPGVIDVGASDDPNASSSRSLKVPHVYLKSMIELKNGLKPYESSTAAAMAGAMAALYIGSGTEKSRDAVERKLMTISKPSQFPLPRVAAKSSTEPVASTPKRAATHVHPITRAASPRYAAPAKRPRRQGRSGAMYCLDPAGLPADKPELADQLQNIISLGGAATVRYDGEVVLAVYPELARQLASYRENSRDHIVLTADGIASVAPRELRDWPSRSFISLYETTIPLCER